MSVQLEFFLRCFSITFIQLHLMATQVPSIYCPKQFHYAATQNPGHSTKFVTLPSSLLGYMFHICVRIGSLCYCNRQ